MMISCLQVFPGQKILVPLKNDDVFNESSACAAGAQGTKLNPIAAGHESMGMNYDFFF